MIYLEGSLGHGMWSIPSLFPSSLWSCLHHMATVEKSCQMKPNLKTAYPNLGEIQTTDNCCTRQTMYKESLAASSYIQDSGNVQCAIKDAH